MWGDNGAEDIFSEGEGRMKMRWKMEFSSRTPRCSSLRSPPSSVLGCLTLTLNKISQVESEFA